MKISIIIPVFNAEKTLSKCLQSVLKQDNDFLELIVVDNNSSDKSAEIIKTYAKYDKRLRYVFEAKKGRGSARQRVLREARGDIIAMIDADCIAPENWLRQIVEKISSGEVSAVMGFEDDAIKNYWTKMRQSEDEKTIFAKVKNDFINHLDTKNFACRADILKEIGFDESLSACEDIDLFFNFQKKGIKIFFLPTLRVSHFHDSSWLELFKTESQRAFFYTSILKKHGFPPEPFINFLSFPFWAIWQIIKNPYRAPYRLLSDFAWKLGIVKYYLSQKA